MQIGNHIVADIIVDKTIFKNILHKNFFSHFDEQIQSSLIKNNMTLLNKVIHFFDGPEGAFTALYLLSESHLSFHSWPEYNYIAIDIFTCGKCQPKNIIDDISLILNATKINIRTLNRSIPY
jgi:S-adenosylmethionine decarboxylase